jgi:hypothetical protein
MSNQVNVQDIARQAKIAAFTSMGISDPRILAQLLGEDVKVSVPVSPVPDAPVPNPVTANKRAKGLRSGAPMASGPASAILRAASQSAVANAPQRAAAAAPREKVCGRMDKTTGAFVPCAKCAGPKDPSKHYSFTSQAIACDNIAEPITRENWRDRMFLAVTGGSEGKWAGNYMAFIMGTVVSLQPERMALFLVNANSAVNG